MSDSGSHNLLTHLEIDNFHNNFTCQLKLQQHGGTLLSIIFCTSLNRQLCNDNKLAQFRIIDFLTCRDMLVASPDITLHGGFSLYWTFCKVPKLGLLGWNQKLVRKQYTGKKNHRVHQIVFSPKLLVISVSGLVRTWLDITFVGDFARFNVLCSVCSMIVDGKPFHWLVRWVSSSSFGLLCWLLAYDLLRPLRVSFHVTHDTIILW